MDSFEELQEAQEVSETLEVPEASESLETQESQETPEALEEKVSNKEKLMRSLVSDDDEVDELTVDSIRQMLDAAPRWFLDQWKLLLLCLVGIFLYITMAIRHRWR